VIQNSGVFLGKSPPKFPMLLMVTYFFVTFREYALNELRIIYNLVVNIPGAFARYPSEMNDGNPP